MPAKKNNRTTLLQNANKLVDGIRDANYGDPVDNFQTTAEFWQTYLVRIIDARDGELDLKPHDVAAMMTLLKVARLAWTPDNEDHWTDGAGYMACGWDCTVRQED